MKISSMNRFAPLFRGTHQLKESHHTNVFKDAMPPVYRNVGRLVRELLLYNFFNLDVFLNRMKLSDLLFIQFLLVDTTFFPNDNL